MAKLRFVTSTAAAAALMLGVPAAAQEVVPAPAPVAAPVPAPTPVERSSGSESGGRTNVLYLGPVSLLAGSIPLEFEHALSPGNSFAIFGSVLTPVAIISDPQAAGYSRSGFSIGGAFRGYFFGSAPTGLFFGPEVELGFASVAGPGGATGSGTSVNGRVLVGYSLVTPGGFAFSVGAGLGYGSTTATASAGGVQANLEVQAFSPHMRAHIGYGF